MFGHARLCYSCETTPKENLRVERVPQIPETDRGRAGSDRWELLFVRADTTALSKSKK